MTPKKIDRVVALISFLLFFVMSALVPGSRAEASAVYSLEDCLEIAGQNHPDIAGAAASVASSKGRLALGAAGDRMTVNGRVSASRNYSARGESSSYSFGLTASVKLYDANRNKYTLDASRATLSATESEALHTLSGVRADVKSAYLAILLDYEIERQRADSVSAFEQHLEQARGFYEAGSKPWYDVTKAEVDLGNAQMSLVEASANLRNAHAALANAMGIDPSEDFDVARQELDILSVPDEAVSEAEALAMENRPDYAAAVLKVDAGKSTLSAKARADSPTISLSGSYGGGEQELFDFWGGRGWSTGLQMSVPILDGGAAAYDTDIARAQVSSLESSREKLRQGILLDVSRAKSDMVKARERIRISGITLENAEENRKLAEGRYETGVGDAMEVTDALLSYTAAILASKQARYDLQIAIVNLERAVGLEFGLN